MSLLGPLPTIGRHLGLTTPKDPAPSYRDQYRPASWRGVPFVVLSVEDKFGREVAVHKYPFRNGAFAEDIGRSAPEFTLTGYLIGDDVIDQAAALRAACEQPGPGELIHPILGRLTLTLLKPITIGWRWDNGRVAEIQFSFIESTGPLYPGISQATQEAVNRAADRLDAVAPQSWGDRMLGSLSSGAASVTATYNAASLWASNVQLLINDATNLIHYLGSLPDQIGDLFNGGPQQRQTVADQASAARLRVAQAIGAMQATPLPSPRMVAARSGSMGALVPAIAGAVGARISVPASIGSTSAAAPSLAANFGTAIQAIAAAPFADAPASADQIRLLLGPASFRIVHYTAPSPTGIAIKTAEQATGDLCRRAALTVLARIAAQYQPTSHDDAVSVRDRVAGAIDAEIAIAGDQGEDGPFLALKELRAAVIRDLTDRGASLAPLTNVAVQASLPASVLAQRLYQDAGRTDQLIAAATPLHPAFMPFEFKALGR